VAHLHRRGLDLFAAHVAEMPDEADFHPAALRIASSLGDMLKHRGEQRERLGAYRRTLDIAERLVARFPGQAAYRSLAGYWQGTLGSVLSAAGQAREAEGAYRRAVAHYQAALALEPTRAAALNNWAWLLATCPEVQLRDARRAVDLGTKAVGLIPRRGDLLNTLGFAHYRVGDWDAAIAALEQSRAFYAKRPEAETLESFSAFPLAMAHWQKGDHAEARRWYEQAVRWMENYRQRDEELLRFRAEAAGLLGINDSP
jgi:tetratricopeptide (TPR) repeat protein